MYKPENNSMGSGQVLHCPYPNKKAKMVLMEMADQLALDLVEKGIVTDQLVLPIGYDKENLNDTEKIHSYTGKIKIDHYGKVVPQHAQGTISLIKHTSSGKKIINSAKYLLQTPMEDFMVTAFFAQHFNLALILFWKK